MTTLRLSHTVDPIKRPDVARTSMEEG